MKSKIRKKINKLLHNVLGFISNLIVAIQELVGLTNRYHPHPFRPLRGETTYRNSEDRFKAIENHFTEDNSTVLDIGCQEGYFLFRLSKYPGLKLGIDMDENALDYARALSRKYMKTM